MARAISKNQVSDPGPSWPSCLSIYLLHANGTVYVTKMLNKSENATLLLLVKMAEKRFFFFFILISFCKIKSQMSCYHLRCTCVTSKGKANKRTMMVLYRSPEYQAVKIDNEDRYQKPNFKAK